MDIDGKIIKYIDGDNNTLLTAKTVETPLLDAADTETFLLREYAQAKNDVPVRSVEVEDSLIKMYYYDANGNSVEYMPDAPYVVNTVTVHSATDKMVIRFKLEYTIKQLVVMNGRLIIV